MVAQLPTGAGAAPANCQLNKLYRSRWWPLMVVVVGGCGGVGGGGRWWRPVLVLVQTNSVGLQASGTCAQAAAGP